MDKIKLNWKLSDTYVEEHFEPYSEVELLYLLENDENINSEIDRKYENRNIRVDEMKISDYVCEINSIYSIQKLINNEENDEELIDLMNRAFTVNNLVQIMIEILKIDYSIVTNGIIVTSNAYLEDNVVKFVRALDRLKKEYHNMSSENQMLQFQIINENINVFDNSSIKGAVDEIITWLAVLVGADNLEKEEGIKIFKIINDLIYKLPELMGFEYSNRYSFIRKIVRHGKFYKKYNSINKLCASISQEEYFKACQDLKNQIQDKMIDLQWSTVTIDEIRDDVDTAIINLKKLEVFFGSGDLLIGVFNSKIRQRLKRKYYETSGCFGIMESGLNSYFAFSGIGDYEGKLKCIGTNDDIEKLASLVNRELFSNNYIWARLTDGTKRYTEVIRDKFENNGTKKYIVTPIELGSDTEVGDFSSIGFTYGCVERKMQAKCNLNNFKKKYFIRWAPCDKCIPSLKDEKDCEVYALNTDSMEWSLFKRSILRKYKLDYRFVPVYK